MYIPHLPDGLPLIYAPTKQGKTMFIKPEPPEWLEMDRKQVLKRFKEISKKQPKK